MILGLSFRECVCGSFGLCFLLVVGGRWEIQVMEFGAGATLSGTRKCARFRVETRGGRQRKPIDELDDENPEPTTE